MRSHLPTFRSTFYPLTASPSPFANMFSSASHLSQPSDPYYYGLPNLDLYLGPIDVPPAEMPELFDILLSDVNEELLHNEISKSLGSAYLSETPRLTSPRPTIDGIMSGVNCHMLFPLVVRLFGEKSPSYNIHFLYDSGSPFTFLSQEVRGVPKHFTCNH